MGGPWDLQVSCMTSLEGLKWTSILVLFRPKNCVSFGRFTIRPLNVHLDVHRSNIDVNGPTGKGMGVGVFVYSSEREYVLYFSHEQGEISEIRSEGFIRESNSSWLLIFVFNARKIGAVVTSQIQILE